MSSLELIADTDGHTRNIHAIKSEGRPNTDQKDRDAIRSLEAKAVEAVSQYRFKPATLNGKPVPCRLNMQLNFHLF